ncbi:MAG: cytochrome c3 family protein, partial [Phycisphaerales bacterium]|nr:cytochrome c3 family protein [Phycisphaerales bacterium]
TWVPYHAGEIDKPFDCGRCHTTGYDAAGGNQHGLPGLIGTWTEDGIRCEACHGPSSDHVTWPTEMLPLGGKDCDECHYRDSQFRMPWSGGFMKHHQQGEDLTHSPHAGRLNCSSCHDPHRSTVNDDGGMFSHCTDCHPGDADNGYYLVDEMEDVDCIECHMPYMAKSAEATGPYKADIRGHLFQITTAPVYAADNVYQEGSGMFWKQNLRGQSYVTLDYACLGCHEEIDEELTMAEASAYAANIHTMNHAGPMPCPADLNDDGLFDLSDINLFVTAFLTQDPVADMNGDGLFDLADITLFGTLFLSGCQ